MNHKNIDKLTKSKKQSLRHVVVCNRKFKLKTFIDLFCGIGGFRLALESFGLECVFSSDWDKHAQTTYSENFGEIPKGDITKIKETEVPSHDVLCAGFPCQAFSISGKQGGFDDTRGTLFFDIARIAKHRKPDVLFLENVKNLVRHDKGKTIETVKRVLEELGYKVHCEVINSSHFGVPQSRARVFIVGFRKDLKIKNFKFPEPLSKDVRLKNILLKEKSKTKRLIIKRKDIKIRQRENLSLVSPRKPVRIGTINNGGQGERIYSIEGHAITLSAYGGGVASKTGAYLVDGEVRKLHPRECVRLMGFPDTFKIPVSDAQAYKQFGNSVVVPVVKAIFQEIINACGGRK